MRHQQQALLREAYYAASHSPDPSTQNGAFLTDANMRPLWGTMACNEFPTRVKYTPERWERPLKYAVIEHAERNAIFSAARCGICTYGLTMVCPWAACADCARAIIQAGISTLLTHQDAFDRSPERWKESIAIAYTMLDEAGVKVEWFQGPVGSTPEVRHSGEVWTP